jgi:carbon storage regulator
MLVIGREIGEVIVIGDHIRVQVVAVENGQVRLGIDAPRQVPVHRVEVYRRIREQERLKAQG